jgi:hypothetical protein
MIVVREVRRILALALSPLSLPLDLWTMGVEDIQVRNRGASLLIQAIRARPSTKILDRYLQGLAPHGIVNG